MVGCGKKVLTFRISGLDKYQWVVLVDSRGLYFSIVEYGSASLMWESIEEIWRNIKAAIENINKFCEIGN